MLFGVSLIQTMETKISCDYEKSDRAGEQIDAGVLHLFKNFEETVESINANSKIVGQINETMETEDVKFARVCAG